MSRRRNARILVLTFLAALAMPLAGGSALAAGGAPPADAGVTLAGGHAAVTARCTGGPGRVVIEASAPSEDGSYLVTVTGQRMVEGSTWKVLVEWEEDAQQQRFRRTAVDGSWSVSTVFSRSDHQPAFDVEASGSVDGQPRFGCFDLVLVGEGYAAGLTACGHGEVALLARQRDDGSIGVGAFLVRGRPHQRWNVDLRATAGGSETTVSFQDYSNRWSELVSRVRFDGLAPEPTFRLRIGKSHAASCWIGLTPGSHLASTNTARSGDSALPRLLKERTESS